MTKQSSDQEFSSDGASSVRTWLSLLGGGLAWTVHFLISSTSAEWGSIANLNERLFLGINQIAWVVIAVTALSVAATLGALGESVKLLHHFRRQADGRKLMHKAETAQERAESCTGVYLMRVGICSNCVFLLIILAQTLAVFFFSGAG